MCLSKAYITKDGEKELLLEEVSSLRFEDTKLVFTTLFGEQKEMEASIKQINFLTHSIILGSPISHEQEGSSFQD